MEDINKRVRSAYFELLAKLDDLNALSEKPEKEDVPNMLGVKDIVWDTCFDMFDGMYDDILSVSIWKNSDGKYSLGSTIEIFDENGYLRNMTEEEKKARYYVTYKLEAKYVAEVDANSLAEARMKADTNFSYADFGVARDVEGEALVVENSKGDRVWEQERPQRGAER